jgi:hypothetical protein
MMPSSEIRRALLAALTLLPAGFAQAAPLSGFDAYAAWDQPLPGLLEFSSLTFLAGDPLALTAAQGGTTIRVLETLRIERMLNLSGSFSFFAQHIEVLSGGFGITDAAVVELVGDAAPSDPDGEAGVTIGSGSTVTHPGVGLLGGTISLSPAGPLVILKDITVPQDFTLGTVVPAYSDVTLELEIVEVRPVPLPAALPLLVSGVGLLAARARRRG